MSDFADLIAALESLSATRVLCIGDLMLDCFIYGTVKRISPEAPIPVFTVDHETTMLGGAGNVVANLVSLGLEACFISIVGDDSAGRTLTSLIAKKPRVEAHLLVESGRRTTIKTRYVANTQQMLRADRETVESINGHLAEDIIIRAAEALPTYGSLVLSDYGKGVIGGSMAQRLISKARAENKTILIDPKGQDYTRYRQANIITPNCQELAKATGMPAMSDTEVVAAAKHLISFCDLEAVVVTRGKEGMSVVSRTGEPTHLLAETRDIYDVSGAGDTVLAVLAASMAAGINLITAATLANIAAGIVVGKTGTATVTIEEIKAHITKHRPISLENKLFERINTIAKAAKWRKEGLKIGFTNGCFDLLHPGHISLLNEAKAACDRLIVGVNSDQSVKRLKKGKNRPIHNEQARATILASLSAVDAVVIFTEDTPIELIRAIKPEVLIKGSDYQLDQVIGAEDVIAYGGQVILTELIHGHSTTSVIERLHNYKQ